MRLWTCPSKGRATELRGGRRKSVKKITSRLPAVPHKTLFCLLVIGQTFFPASDSFAQSVPARAQKAFERGKIAAKGRNWRLAIKYFTQARKAAPRAPVFLYALGNAHNETRHPVLAAVYFQAYLEAFPKAPNGPEGPAKYSRTGSLPRPARGGNLWRGPLHRQKASQKVGPARGPPFDTGKHGPGGRAG